MSTPAKHLRKEMEKLFTDLEDLGKVLPYCPPKCEKYRTKKIARYQIPGSRYFIHEHNLRTVQHIWTRRDAILNPSKLGIPYTEKWAEDLKRRTNAHSGVFTIGSFLDADLIKFTPRDIEDVRAILSELGVSLSLRGSGSL